MLDSGLSLHPAQEDTDNVDISLRRKWCINDQQASLLHGVDVELCDDYSAPSI